MCRLFSTYVTGRWTGEVQDPDVYDTCFSTWYLPGDLTDSIIDITAISQFSERSSKLNAVNGYYCTGNDQCFGTYYSEYPWWGADLGKVQRVSSVTVITRNFPSHSESYFRNMVVYLSNNSDHTNNATFGTYPDIAPISGTTVIFTPPAPMYGRFLKIQTLDANVRYLVICELRIN